MFTSKRKDKFTTGLINTRNDCFANSSVQAFASLPGLNLYLNDILQRHQDVQRLGLEEIPKLPLHMALAVIVDQLQEQITTTKAMSVWPFLQVIESIFNSKISTNQNDAHELIQLILETLENENIKLKKFNKSKAIKKDIIIPEFPFNGLLADQLTCLSCRNSSTPSFHPFSVFSIPVPESNTAKLTEMFKNSESETINGYNCLRCKINAILKIEEGKKEKGVVITDELSQILSQLQDLNNRNVSINSDLSETLENFIKNYKYETFIADAFKSTIVKKTLVVKAPKLLTVHLSRSMFSGQFFTRNGCRVEFDELLNVEIDDELVEIYQEKLRAAKREKRKTNMTVASIHEEATEEEYNNYLENDEEDEEDIVGYDDDRNEPEQLARIHSKVLTKHDEAIDKAAVEQEEDIHSHMETLDDEADDTHAASTTFEIPGDSDDEADDDDDDDSESFEEESHDVFLNKENAQYKLKAIIRHQGTHNAGHYECFRHKPLFVKDVHTDNVVNLSPAIIIPEDLEEQQKQQQKQKQQQQEQEPKSNNSSNADLPTPPDSNSSSGRVPPIVSSHSPTALHDSLSPISPPQTIPSETHELNYDSEDSTSSFSRFRNMIGSFVGRRPSVTSSNGSTSRRGSIAGGSAHNNHAHQEGAHDGLSTVTESRDSATDLDAKFANHDINGSANGSHHHHHQHHHQHQHQHQHHHDPQPDKKDRKYKKMSTVSKYPFWRISDTQVNEVRVDDVLREKAGVYMIYYEKV